MDNTSVQGEQWVINVTVDAHDLSTSEHVGEEVDYDEDEQDDEDDGTFVIKCGTCPICQEEAVEPKIVLECGHTFDEECFKEFITYELRNSKTVILCPFCRSYILQIEAQTPEPRPRPQNILQSEQTQPPPPPQTTVNQNRPPSVFQQRLHEFLLSRHGRYCVHILVEVTIVGLILLIIYAFSCNRGQKCMFQP